MSGPGNRGAIRLVKSVHEWAGLLAFIGILVIGASGAAIVFLGDLFEWQYGDVVSVGEAERELPVADAASLMAAASESRGEAFTLQGVLMPHSRLSLDVALVYGSVDGEPREDPLMVAVNPHTGEVQGSFWLDKALGHELVHLHESLLAGAVGRWVVLSLAIAILLFALSGLYLWWPRRESLSGKIARTTWRNPRTTAFALHSLLGFWLAPFLIYYAATGIATAKPGWFGPLLQSPFSEAPAFAETPAATFDPVAMRQAIDSAARQFGERRLGMVYIEDGAIGMSFKAQGDLNIYQGDAYAWADLRTGQLAHSLVTTEHSASMAIGGGMHSLHSGLTFGPVGMALTLLSGIGLVVLSLLGLMRWWQRWRGSLSPVLRRGRGLSEFPRIPDTHLAAPVDQAGKRKNQG